MHARNNPLSGKKKSMDVILNDRLIFEIIKQKAINTCGLKSGVKRT